MGLCESTASQIEQQQREEALQKKIAENLEREQRLADERKQKQIQFHNEFIETLTNSNYINHRNRNSSSFIISAYIRSITSKSIIQDILKIIISFYQTKYIIYSIGAHCGGGWQPNSDTPKVYYGDGTANMFILLKLTKLDVPQMASIYDFQPTYKFTLHRDHQDNILWTKAGQNSYNVKHFRTILEDKVEENGRKRRNTELNPEYQNPRIISDGFFASGFWFLSYKNEIQYFSDISWHRDHLMGMYHYKCFENITFSGNLSQKIKSQIKQISFGIYHVVFLLYNGYAFGWGNLQGQSSNGDITRDNKPYLINGIKNIEKVVCGKHITFFLLKNGTVFAIGSERRNTGALSVALKSIKYSGFDPRRLTTIHGDFRQIMFDEKVIDIDIGGERRSCKCLALTEKGNVYYWGWWDKVIYEPQKMCLSQFIVSISVGVDHAVLMTDKGDIVVFGDNKSNQLFIEEKCTLLPSEARLIHRNELSLDQNVNIVRVIAGWRASFLICES
eukprot:285500_1